jgi:putative peptidoglycan lipid II flippase
VAALAAGHSVGLTVLGVALLVLAARTVGRDALRGLGRTGVAAVVAGIAAAGAGLGAVAVIPASGHWARLGQGAAAGAVVLVVFAVVAAAVDGQEVRPAARRLAGRFSRRLAPIEGESRD